MMIESRLLRKLPVPRCPQPEIAISLIPARRSPRNAPRGLIAVQPRHADIEQHHFRRTAATASTACQPS
jgi:hypothetical protein